MQIFNERLWPPLSWWLLGGGGFALTVAVIALVPAGPTGALIALAVTAALVAGALVAYAATVRVDAAGLTAGRARLPWAAIGRVRALDAETAQSLRGPAADPAAYLLLRSFLPTAVAVEVVDEADPTPYWYVSTRSPERLAAALRDRPGDERT